MKKKKSKKFKKLDQDDIIKAFFPDEIDPPLRKSTEPETRQQAASKPKPPPEPIEIGRFAGIDASSSRKLKRGKYQVEASLDLHGYTLNAAWATFRNFIDSSYRNGCKCVLVITGKGHSGAGAIKSNIIDWLNQPDIRQKIIAVSQASIRDGGGGAIYILLRKNRKV